MALVGHEILITVPINTFFMVIDLEGGSVPYSWKSVHTDFPHIIQLTFSMWMSGTWWCAGIIQRWLYVYYAFAFFAFFGFTREARVRYRRAYLYLARRLGLPAATAVPTVYALFWHYYVLQQQLIFCTSGLIAREALCSRRSQPCHTTACR